MAPIISSADINKYKGLQQFFDYIGSKKTQTVSTPEAFDYTGDNVADNFDQSPKTTVGYTEHFQAQKGTFGDIKDHYYFKSDNFYVMAYSDGKNAAIRKVAGGYEYYIEGKKYFAPREIELSPNYLGNRLHAYLEGEEQNFMPGQKTSATRNLGKDGSLPAGTSLGDDGMANFGVGKKVIPLNDDDGRTIVCDLDSHSNKVISSRVYDRNGALLVEFDQGGSVKTPSSKATASKKEETLHNKLDAWMQKEGVALTNKGGTAGKDYIVTWNGQDIPISKDMAIGDGGWGDTGLVDKNQHRVYFGILDNGDIILKKVDPSTKETSEFTVFKPGSDGKHGVWKTNADIAPASASTKGSRSASASGSKTAAGTGASALLKKDVLAKYPAITTKAPFKLETELKSGETVIIPAGTTFDTSGWANLKDDGSVKAGRLKDGHFIVANVNPQKQGQWYDYTLYDKDGTVKETKKASGGTDAPVAPGTNPVVTTTTGGSQLVSHTSTDNGSGSGESGGGGNNTLLIGGAAIGLFLLLRSQKRKQAAAQQQWAFQQQAMMAQQGGGGAAGVANVGGMPFAQGTPPGIMPQFQPSFLPPGSQVNQQQTMFA